MWPDESVTFEIDDADSPVAEVTVHTPEGRIVLVAEFVSGERSMRLLRAHVDSDFGANQLGSRRLYGLAQLAMRRMDIDELVVEGAVRSTGANPGHTPKPFRFTRRDRAEPR